jgi:hypothetical protein
MNALHDQIPVATVGKFSRNGNVRWLKLRASLIGWNAASLSRLLRRNMFVDHILINPLIE